MITEGTLDHWWRKAVLARWDERCAVCLKPRLLECHHIVHRRRKLLRWDWRNGIPLCHECHSKHHDFPWRDNLEGLRIDMDYLQQRKQVVLKDYLREQGLRESEWRAGILADLKTKVTETLWQVYVHTKLFGR